MPPKLVFCSSQKTQLINTLDCVSVIISSRLAGSILAEVAKLVYALDLGSSAARRESSSLSFRTKLMANTPTESKAWRGCPIYVGVNDAQ